MIEYFYSAHSAFAYLGSKKLAAVALQSGRTIVHKPFDLRRALDQVRGPGFKPYGANHMAYFFGREIERWSEWRNAPVMGHYPTYHHHDIELPNCLLIAALEQGATIDALAHSLLEAHWRDDADLADPSTLVRLAASEGFDGAGLLTAAESTQVRAIYEANTSDAISRSVFGSPTYFVDGDMFYGQDHLEMIERAIVRPFEGEWPRD